MREFIITRAESAKSLQFGEGILHFVPEFSYGLVILNFTGTIGLGRNFIDPCMSSDVITDLVGVIGLVRKNVVAINLLMQGVDGTDGIMLIATNQFEAKGNSREVNQEGQLCIVATLSLSKPLFIRAQRVSAGILVCFDVGSIQHQDEGIGFVFLTEPLEHPVPHSRIAPTAKGAPDAIPLSILRWHLVPHRSGTQNPPDAVEQSVEVLIRTPALAAYLFSVFVVNFFAPSRTADGISSALCFVMSNHYK